MFKKAPNAGACDISENIGHPVGYFVVHHKLTSAKLLKNPKSELSNHRFVIQKFNDENVVFAAPTACERDFWVENITVAARGCHHNRFVDLQEMINLPTAIVFALELEEIRGMLHKHNSRSILRTTHEYNFVLLGLDLRYFDAGSTDVTKPRKIICLETCCEVNNDQGHVILKLQSDGDAAIDLETASSDNDDQALSAASWVTLMRQNLYFLKHNKAGICGVDLPPSGRRLCAFQHRREYDFSKEDFDMDNSSTTIPQLSQLPRDWLAQHVMLLSTHQLYIKDLVPMFVMRRVHCGEVVLWEDTLQSKYMILQHGEVELSKGQQVIGRSTVFSSGKVALLHSCRRHSTVRAVSECVFWILSREKCVDKLKEMHCKLREEKTKLLVAVSLFENLALDVLEKLVEVMYLRSFCNEERIIKQGDDGNCLFIIRTGRVIITQTSLSTSIELCRIGTGKVFGELALLSNEPRKAHVHALEGPVECWCIDRTVFVSLFGSMSELQMESTGISILRNVQLLKPLNSKSLVALARALTSTAYNEGEVIIHQGDQGDSFFMIAKGMVSVAVNHIEVAQLKAGAFFGEGSLLSNEKRNATITAITPTQCLVLNRSQFHSMLGPLLATITQEYEKRKKDKESHSRLGSSSSSGMFSMRSLVSSIGQSSAKHDQSQTTIKYDFDQFDIVMLLEQRHSNLCNVYLARHCDSGKLYSLKVMEKALVGLFGLEKQVCAERDILRSIDHPNVACLYGTFVDGLKLYFVQQYLPGGNLRHLLYETKVFGAPSAAGGISLAVVQYLAATMLSVLGELHDLDILHRDYKIDNFSFHDDGRLCLVDLNFARRCGADSRCWTVCGSVEYMAPEMICCRGYNRSVDRWSLAICIYELLTRTTPFHHDHVALIYENICAAFENVNEAAEMKAMPPCASALLCGMLRASPCCRLGLLRNQLEDLWQHPFFNAHSEHDWRNLAPPAIMTQLLCDQPDSDDFLLDCCVDIDTWTNPLINTVGLDNF